MIGTSLQIQRTVAVLITTYALLLSSAELRSSDWDYVVLDEGQKIKNSSNKTAMAAHATPARHRISMTGESPVQYLEKSGKSTLRFTSCLACKSGAFPCSFVL